MRKCFRFVICKSWFWLHKSKNFNNIPSCNISWLGRPNIKSPFEKPAYQRWFSKWDITYWFYNAWQTWTWRIDWTITYPSLKEFSKEFYSYLSGWSTKHDKPFAMGIVPFFCFHSSWSSHSPFAFRKDPVKWTTNKLIFFSYWVYLLVCF